MIISQIFIDGTALDKFRGENPMLCNSNMNPTETKISNS